MKKAQHAHGEGFGLQQKRLNVSDELLLNRVNDSTVAHGFGVKKTIVINGSEEQHRNLNILFKGNEYKKQNKSQSQ